ncbi:hypothetical protein D3C85_1300860 [compost metagenome]
MIELLELGMLPLLAVSFMTFAAASVVQPSPTPLSNVLFGRRLVSLVTMPLLIVTGVMRPAFCLDLTYAAIRSRLAVEY